MSTQKQTINGAPPVPTVLPDAAWREAERSEADRSAASGKTVAGPAGGPAKLHRPNPEVVVDAKRRTFAAQYKIRILSEADVAKKTSGGVGALLRREGLYSSHLSVWRRERDASLLQGLAPRTRGPKVNRNPQLEELDKLRLDKLRLTEALRKAEIVIDIQKKVAALLGSITPGADRQETI